MSDNSFDAAQKALRNRAVVDLEEPLPDEQPARWWLRILVVLVFFGFGAIVWLSWQDNAGDGTPVLVAAPTGPTKEKPEDEGGMELRNQDNSIPEALGGRETAGAAEEPLVIGPQADSTPLDHPRTVEEIPPIEPARAADVADVAGTRVPLDEIEPATGPAGDAPPPASSPSTPPAAQAATNTARTEPSDLVVTPLPPVEGLASPPVLPAAPSSTAAAPAAPTPSAPVATTPPAGPRAIVPPAAPPSEPAPVERAALPPLPEPPPVVAPVGPSPARATSNVRIQFGSLRTEAAANTAWTQVRQRNAAVLDGLRRVIARAEVRGVTYYRAQAEGFESRAAARAACETIKSRGTDCLVVNP